MGLHVRPRASRIRGVPVVSGNSNNDGGRTALSGFLYQMLGVLGLKGQGEAHREDSGLGALLSLASDANAIHEGYDSDVALQLTPIRTAAQTGVVLVQFKFSEAGADSVIAPKEFKEILDRLHAATTAVLKDGKSVSKCFLVSNRAYSRDTQKIVDEIAKNGKSRQLGKDQNAIANGLEFLPGIEPEAWEAALYRFGRRYGLFDNEIESGIKQLLGHILAVTVERPTCEVHQKLLIECLTGTRDAHDLIHKHVRHLMASQLIELGPDPRHAIVARQDAETAFVQHRDRALLLCLGSGGTGKTATLRKWAEATDQTAFLGVRRASRVTKHWIQELVNEWRNTPMCNDMPASSLMRLARANPEMESPLLHLNIDGIDERAVVGANTDALCAILNWFWQEDIKVRKGDKAHPEARLIVTCRTKEDFAEFWYPNTSGSPSIQIECPPTIIFDTFTDTEFAELVRSERATLGELVHNRLMQTTASPVGLSVESQSGPGGVVCDGPSSRSPNAYERMLRHPAIWEAFVELSATNREGFLDGKKGACDALATHYFERFLNKAAARSQHHHRRDNIKFAFSKLAIVSCDESKTVYEFALWNKVIGSELGLGVPFAQELYSEALSAGVIDGERGTWRWRYPIVANHLAALENRK